MTSLINLGKLIEQFNTNLDCNGDAHIRSTGVLIELRKDLKRAQKLISWRDIKSANIDVLAMNFNQMVKDLG